MGRIQLALNVSDLDEAVGFYTKLFGTEPAKLRPGYANFAISDPPLKLVLFENGGAPGTINHLGVEVGSAGEVQGEIARLRESGLATREEEGVECCYSRQDKVWVSGPDSTAWEIYTVIEDSPSRATAACC